LLYLSEILKNHTEGSDYYLMLRHFMVDRLAFETLYLFKDDEKKQHEFIEFELQRVRSK